MIEIHHARATPDDAKALSEVADMACKPIAECGPGSSCAIQDGDPFPA